MIKAHQIKLYPNTSQEVLFRKSCGVARFTFNWALNKWKEIYKSGQKTSAYELIKHLNSIKRVDFPWMQETGKTCSQYAIHNLESAYKNMWKHCKKYPKYKKKGVKDAFVAVENWQQFKQKEFRIRLPRIGWVKCAENLRFEGKVNSVVVKRIADNWFAVINIDTKEHPSVCENQATVGVDMGIKTLLVLSDGTTFENPKALRKNLKGLKRLQRGLSRKQIGSSNHGRQLSKLSRKHYKVSCIRKAAIHNATSYIAKNYGKVVIEDLKPSNMVKNRKVSQAVGDASFGLIAKQLTYKCLWNGVELVKADRWFASSKTCSCCGHKKEILKLSERTYECFNCGLVIDRDLNAAINLANYSPTPKSGGCEASGVVNSSLVTEIRTTVKDEIIYSVTNSCLTA